PARASMFVGSKGIIINDGSGRKPQVFPESLRNNIKPPKQTIVRSAGHFQDWVNAIRNKEQASSNFEYGSRLTEITLLGVLSLRLGGKLIQWDYDNMKANGIPEADQYIKEPVRAGWEM
ncbi:MAG: gfo/Idh/MocA family oxidoreductase, partial [Algoriphagus sp.]|nr:gfo/Idh/MocA family oxidoreductase [Algoriphagus sp.]